MSLKRILYDNAKNIYGWKTKRKIVVICIDDYGNVRLDSKIAREKMDMAGLKINSRFDAYDTLETRKDLLMLYETLVSVKDINNNPAVLTPFALPCNINFESIADEGYEKYTLETLPQTYQKLEFKDPDAYNGTWNLWQEGIVSGLMKPQFHGREHLNLKVFDEKLAKKDHEIITALKNRSFTSISNSGYETIKYTAAFDFSEIKENNIIGDILVDGMERFEEVFGYLPSVFMPPTSKIHPMHFPLLKKLGIKYIDTNLFHKQYLGENKYSKTYNYTGKILATGQINIVRNVVFEPTGSKDFDSIKLAMNQIETAFFWNRPAIISSHRVNFCGHIDPKNREIGITALKDLLKKIVKKWPEVEFMSSDALGDLISASKRNN